MIFPALDVQRLDEVQERAVALEEEQRLNCSLSGGGAGLMKADQVLAGSAFDFAHFFVVLQQPSPHWFVSDS